MSCKKLLIIEDDESIRQMMQDVLELEGYEVVVAPDGQVGIDALRTSDEPPCVIILDMMMPKVNGWQFLELQRQHPEHNRIPVIVCSAYPETAKAVRSHAYITKPVHLHKLTQAVRAVCA